MYGSVLGKYQCKSPVADGGRIDSDTRPWTLNSCAPNSSSTRSQVFRRSTSHRTQHSTSPAPTSPSTTKICCRPLRHDRSRYPPHAIDCEIDTQSCIPPKEQSNPDPCFSITYHLRRLHLWLSPLQLQSPGALLPVFSPVRLFDSQRTDGECGARVISQMVDA